MTFKYPITLNEYQLATRKTADYTIPIIYPGLSVAGEAGEIADKIKKIVHYGIPKEWPKADKLKLILEAGDVLWSIAALAYDLNTTLQEVAKLNIDKTYKRLHDGTIVGDGDFR